ncbi:MAG: DUF4091 domain-containing protein [Thermaceae bacterium]|nr:DUF4091 domain-containing protein [Thermaceae bacterium]
MNRSWCSRPMFFFVLLPVLTGCPAMSPLAQIDPTGSLQVWAVSSLERVWADAPAQANRPIELFAARGEYQSFQIVAFGSKGVRGLNLQVSDLSGPDGATIGKNNITLYREHYVPVEVNSPYKGGSNRPQGLGYYPDALIPFLNPATDKPITGQAVYGSVPIDIAPGHDQPFWVDVLVPRKAKAGLYKGKYSVSGNGRTVEGEFRLTVWNFELPLEPSLQSFVPFWFTYTAAAKIELLRNRLMPGRVAPADVRRLSEYGLNNIELGIGSGANYHTCKASPAPSPEVFKAAKAARKTDLPVYDFAFDEVDECNLGQALRDWGRSMHQAGVLNLATVSPTPELLDDGTGKPAVDVFVLTPQMYEKSKANGMIEAAKAKGASIWFYTALYRAEIPDAPQWLLDYSPMNFRISSGFLAQSLGFNGILYWAADYVDRSRGQDPWQDPRYFENKTVFQGDGSWTYPGDKVGLPGTVVPSMRLKWLRDGVQDYEYIELLKKSGKYSKLAWMVQRLAPDFSNWNHDPTELEATRRKLGQALSQP